jgi:mono/diheme cytochrome c family protein
VISWIAALLLATAGKGDPTLIKGRQLFFDASIGAHGVSCAQCHATVEDEARDGDGLLRPGHSLWGVASRAYWRGDTRRTAFPTLRKAIDVCVEMFQGGQPLGAEDGLRLAAFLESLGPRRGQPPLILQPALEANLDYDRDPYRGGDALRGRRLFYAACHGCHPNGGPGLGPKIRGTSRPDLVQKVREGNGLLRGARIEGAWMAFFGRDRLSDAQLGDIAAYVAHQVEGSAER